MSFKDINALSTTLVQLQEDKWKLEEQLKICKETIIYLTDDLEKKEKSYNIT